MTPTPPKKPPFRKGEWVTEGDLVLVSDRSFRCADDLMIADYEYNSGYRIGPLDAAYYRPATVDELRAESARLRKRADELNAAADAVEKAKGEEMSEQETCQCYFQELYTGLMECNEQDTARSILANIVWYNAASLLGEMTLEEIASAVPGVTPLTLTEWGL